MKLDEIIRKITELQNVQLLDDSKTFSYHVPNFKKNTFFFVRPIADDLIIACSVMNATDENSITIGQRILAAAETAIVESHERLVTKILGFDSGIPMFDSLLILGPAIEKFRMTKNDYFLGPRTYCAYAINNIEFAGDETEAEASVRTRHAILSDVKREISPVIFLRYHKQTGQRSDEHLAIAKHSYTMVLINELPRDGGTVELENYERVGITFATDQGEANLDATFDGKTKKLPVAEALKFMDTLTYKGAEAAKKDW